MKYPVLTRQTFVGLEDIFKTCLLCLPRRIEDVLQRRLGRWKIVTLKTSSRRLVSWRHALKMYWGHVLKTSRRHYGEKQYTYWGYLYLANLNVYLTNLSFTNLYLTILKRIQNVLIRTHHFNIRLIFELKQHLYFKN